MIYFARATDGTGPIKIGCSINLVQRIGVLKTPDGGRANVVAVMDGDFKVEKELHRRFGHLLFPNAGREWFHPGPDLLRFIEHNSRGWSRRKREGDGAVLFDNLVRLGYGQTEYKTAEIAKLVGERTEKKMSRQRVSAILNAVRVTPETIATLAKALRVKPAELTRKPPKKGGGSDA
jgi:transcriptional regulator with XRE-family HTH domain